MGTKQTVLVTEVTDGDTITIAGGDRVRVLGINAPEKGEQGYKPAKDYVFKTILNKEVLLEPDGPNRDQYGRLLRHVWLDGVLVGKEEVRLGLARAKYFNPNQKYKEEIAGAEEQARQENKGIWKQGNFMPGS